MLIQDNLTKHSSEKPEKIAIQANNVGLSYSELDRRSDNLASELMKSGIVKGDRVIIYLENCAENVISIYGILKSAGVFVIINPDFVEERVVKIINNCKPKAIITSDKLFKPMMKIFSNLEYIEKVIVTNSSSDIDVEDNRSFGFEEITNREGKIKSSGTIDIDLASIIYTSGSTGEHKGVSLTHINIISAMNSITKYLDNKESDKILSTLPLSFDYGLYQVLMTIHIGATLFLESSFTFPYPILKKIEEFQITGFPIVPTMGVFISRIAKRSSFNFSSVRYISSTSQIFPESVTRSMGKIFPNAKIFSMYGLTECKRVLFLDPDKILKKPNSVGKPMPNVEVYLVDNDGVEVSNPGEIGELVIRGSNIMAGYWKNDVATNEIIKNGKFIGDRVLFSGDLFKFDEEGDFYFLGRKDDLIKSGGEKIYPREIEEHLYSMDGIVEVVVIGIDDAVLGKTIAAYLTCNKAITSEIVREFLSTKIEKWMMPKKIFILAEMPKTKNGKYDKKELFRIGMERKIENGII